MRRQSLDTGLTQTIAWLWVAFLIAGVVAWFGYRYWRRRHPRPTAAPERSYSQRLDSDSEGPMRCESQAARWLHEEPSTPARMRTGAQPSAATSIRARRCSDVSLRISSMTYWRVLAASLMGG